MSSQVEHTDVGAYALGLLEEDDRRAFEDHLRSCGTCAAELRDMAGTAHALADIRDFTDAVEATAGPYAGPGRRPAAGPIADGPGGPQDAPPGQVIDLMRRRQRAARRARRGTYVIGAAAATVLLAAGVTVGSTLSGSDTPGTPGHAGHGSPAQALVIWGERHSASDGATGASGVVGLESKGWGTHVGLELRGVRGPLRCRLEAVSTTGERSVVTGWAVPPKGYGVPGSQAPLITHGGTAIPHDRLDRFEVVIEGSGNRLLTIPM
jgi:anti-sigma factor RsiW